MKCSKCGSLRSRITGTRDRSFARLFGGITVVVGVTIRWRRCIDCQRKFKTREVDMGDLRERKRKAKATGSLPTSSPGIGMIGSDGATYGPSVDNLPGSMDYPASVPERPGEN